jgi:hypothetical protein
VRSISSAVQKDASAFLYICQMSSCSMGKRTKRCGFSCRSGSRGRSVLGSEIFEVEGVRSEQTWWEIVTGEFRYYYKFPNRSHCL